jgi:hypothetical protein
VARVILARTLDVGVPAAWVTADEAYGRDYKFRTGLGARRVATSSRFPAIRSSPAARGSHGADVLAAHAPKDAWKRRNSSQSAKCPRVFDLGGGLLLRVIARLNGCASRFARDEQTRAATEQVRPRRPETPQVAWTRAHRLLASVRRRRPRSRGPVDVPAAAVPCPSGDRSAACLPRSWASPGCVTGRE